LLLLLPAWCKRDTCMQKHAHQKLSGLTVAVPQFAAASLLCWQPIL
jgi:hypothetical protein